MGTFTARAGGTPYKGAWATVQANRYDANTNPNGIKHVIIQCDNSPNEGDGTYVAQTGAPHVDPGMGTQYRHLLEHERSVRVRQDDGGERSQFNDTADRTPTSSGATCPPRWRGTDGHVSNCRSNGGRFELAVRGRIQLGEQNAATMFSSGR